MASDFDESSANEEASKGLSWWYSADVISRPKEAKTAKRIRRISFTDRPLSHPGRLSIVYFVTLIVIVTGLLLLPISTSDIVFTNFPVAFFTAVSALSTCGIPVVNTSEYRSTFGQIVILFSIQFGGLGVMTFASIVALGASRRLKVSQRMLTANELGTTKLSEIKGVLSVVIGLGRFGGSAASTLDQMGQDVLAVDKNPELVARRSAHPPTIQADMTDVMAIEQIDGPYTVVKIHTPLYAVGRSIEDVQVHDKYGVTVVGIKASGKEFQYGSKELVMHRNDELILMGKQDQIDHFVQG